MYTLHQCTHTTKVRVSNASPDTGYNAYLVSLEFVDLDAFVTVIVNRTIAARGRARCDCRTVCLFRVLQGA
jgi:hypothetical protein